MSETVFKPRIRSKEFHFPLAVRWKAGRKVTVEIEGKAPLDVVPPPEFSGVEPDVWSPEDLFVASCASCLAVTFTGIAKRHQLAFSELEIRGDGVAGQRHGGRFGFTRVELQFRLEVGPDDVAEAERLARLAEETCLVSASFALPVGVSLCVRSTDSGRAFEAA